MKRSHGISVTRHCSNKRICCSLDAIPDAVKSGSFGAVSEQIKVDLFDTVVKSAFPHFDALLTAAWNVVSIYAAVGTEFPDLHTAVVELKHVLDDFDEAAGMGGEEDVKYGEKLDSDVKECQGLLLASTTATQTGKSVDGHLDKGVAHQPTRLRENMSELGRLHPNRQSKQIACSSVSTSSTRPTSHRPPSGIFRPSPFAKSSSQRERGPTAWPT